MPRVYKPDPRRKKYRVYNEELIKEAVAAYKSGNASLKAVAEKYDIDKSVLYRNCTRTLKKHGGQTILSEETELYMIKYINTCAEWGYPFDALDLRYIVKGYLDKMGSTVLKFKNNLPGPDFATSFLKRHKEKISQRIAENVKKNRAAVSPETIKEYIKELKTSLIGVDPSNIINYDETNLTDDPGRKKIIVKRGTKYPERVMNHSKASTSIMISATADGVLLPPYVVYKALNIYDTWTLNGPVGARYNRTQSGWFDGSMFEDWIKEIVLPFFKNKEGKKCLIGDNLSSHLSIDVIKLCSEQNINFVFLPANSTHLTQPLDVAFFRPMKIAWRNIMLQWKKTDGKAHSCVPKGCFPRLLKKLMEELHDNSENNIKAGFRKTGINPIEVNEILSRLPENRQNNIEMDKDALDKSVLDLLKEMRYGTMNITEPRKKKKIEVIAGRSVGTDSLCIVESGEQINKQACEETHDSTNKDTDEKENKKFKGKGKGKGKKNKSQQKILNNGEHQKLNEGKKDNLIVSEKCLTDSITSFDIDLDLDGLDFGQNDIDKIPILFEDGLLYENEVVVETDIHEINNGIKEYQEQRNKIGDMPPNTYNGIPKKEKSKRKLKIQANDQNPSTSKRRSSYNYKDDDILQDLMDDNI